MSAEQKLYKALISSTTLEGLVGNRIYPLPMPQARALTSPSLTYERQGGERVYSLTGYAGLENPTFAINLYAASVTSLTALTTAVIGAVEGSTEFSSVSLTDQEDDWDDDLQQRTRFLEFSIWNRE